MISFSPGSGAFGHVTIMHNDQHGADAEIDSAHACQKPRQFTVFGTLKYVQRHSYCQQAKACEYPGRSGLHSHRAATPHSVTKQDYPARIPASRGIHMAKDTNGASVAMRAANDYHALRRIKALLKRVGVNEFRRFF